MSYTPTRVWYDFYEDSSLNGMVVLCPLKNKVPDGDSTILLILAGSLCNPNNPLANIIETLDEVYYANKDYVLIRWIDFNDDGLRDIFFASSCGQTDYFMVYMHMSSGYLLRFDKSSDVAYVGDVDGDPNTDLLLGTIEHGTISSQVRPDGSIGKLYGPLFYDVYEFSDGEFVKTATLAVEELPMEKLQPASPALAVDSISKSK
ncbi:MAG: hypothetical protein HJJLKODD_02873 [Phycisphaerae bacterium]|nr:hypothetical protein [Phycisphaerae bacterium]